MSGDSLSARLDFAVEMAWRAGKITLSHFQTGISPETKADGSIVTAADREAETLCRDRIGRYFPGDGIVGEEFGVERPEAPRRWILDPIDGTISFARGVPLYGVLIALEEGTEATLGVLHFPGMGETVWAARGQGCWWNGRPARVSVVDRLDLAAVMTTDAERFRLAAGETGSSGGAPAGGTGGGDMARSATASAPEVAAGGGPSRQAMAAGYERLRSRVRLVRTWGDCYGHALVATGRAEVMLDPISAVWDAAPLRPVIEEAGGIFTDWRGDPTHRGGSAVSTNRALAAETRRLLG